MIGILIASTIFFTDPAANVGVSSWVWPDGTRTTTDVGYLQVTGEGVGVCSSAGWSCNEIEFPETLHILFPTRADVTRIEVGRAFSDEVAAVLAGSYFPTFFGGSSPLGHAVWTGRLEDVDGFDLFGIGFPNLLNPNIGSAVTLFSVDWMRHVGPQTPVGIVADDPCHAQNTGCQAVAEPSTWALLVVGVGVWASSQIWRRWRRATAVIAYVRHTYGN